MPMKESTTGAERGSTPPTKQEGMAEAWIAALTLARKAGSGMALARKWIVDESLQRHTAATLTAAFGVGVITGWLVKRR